MEEGQNIIIKNINEFREYRRQIKEITEIFEFSKQLEKMNVILENREKI